MWWVGVEWRQDRAGDEPRSDRWVPLGNPERTSRCVQAEMSPRIHYSHIPVQYRFPLPRCNCPDCLLLARSVSRCRSSGAVQCRRHADTANGNPLNQPQPNGLQNTLTRFRQPFRYAERAVKCRSASGRNIHCGKCSPGPFWPEDTKSDLHTMPMFDPVHFTRSPCSRIIVASVPNSQ